METKIIDSFYGHPAFEQKDTLPIITVYYDPLDFPGKYVARLFNLAQPSLDASVRESLEELYKTFPSDTMFQIGRHPNDDPKIVEVWV